MLGKRKRDTKVVSRSKHGSNASSSPPDANMDAGDVFRRHFETMFTPLPEPKSEQVVETEDEESDDASEVSEWSGLSKSDNDLPIVEVVDYATAQNGEDSDEFHRARQKAFMSSRPPREVDELKNRNGNDQSKPTTAGEDDLTERLNLKHDLDLQRLLRESHLLEKSKTSANPAKQRQMALDLRLQSLGAKQSIFTQQKMPATHRLGITKKADERQSKRRAEAKENGVVLEKASKKTGPTKRRERGVDVPGVGKFTGGTLKLSRRDVASIQGSPAARRGKKR